MNVSSPTPSPTDVAAPAAPQAADAAPPAEVPAGHHPRHKVIRPRRGWQAINLGELWRYRELLFFLIWRDVLVRYKQTVFGAAWAIIQPVMTMVVFAVFFGRFGRMDQLVEGAYPVFVFAALLPWTFFATAVGQAAVSLISSAHLISKVYFPRLLVPAATVGAGLVDFSISFLVMIALMIGYGVPLRPSLLLVPVFTALAVLAALGVGTLLAALVVSYRDFRYVVTFAIQLWMFASPVAYPLDIIPESWQLVYSLNPMVGPIVGFRSAILGESLPWGCVAVSTLSTIVCLLIGMYYFRRVERRFADII